MPKSKNKRKKATKPHVTGIGHRKVLQLQNGVDLVLDEVGVKIDNYRNPISNYEILEYLIYGGLYKEFQRFLESHYERNALTVPIEQQVLNETIFLLFPYSSKTDDTKAYEELIKRIATSVIQPLSLYLRETIEGKLYLASMRSTYRQMARSMLDHVVGVMGTNGEICHTLDLEGVGGLKEEDIQQTYRDIGLDFNDPEIQQLACNGFRQTCNYIVKNKKGERHHILDWYLQKFHLLDSRRFSRQILKYMQELCQQGKPQREFLLDYYESNMDLFNHLFEEYPEYDFIEHGKYERYELLGDFAEKLGITMGGEAEILPFFPPQQIERKDGNSNSQTKYPPIDNKTYRTMILKALDQLHRRIIHNSPKAYWVNIWPNDIKINKTAEIVGKYIAIVYELDNEAWILVDSIEQGNAIYLWHGERAMDGLQLFMQHKTYVKTRPNVYRRNHGIRRNKATYDIYVEILQTANGLGVLG